MEYPSGARVLRPLLQALAAGLRVAGRATMRRPGRVLATPGG